jgi:hypothetical protein
MRFEVANERVCWWMVDGMESCGNKKMKKKEEREKEESKLLSTETHEGRNARVNNTKDRYVSV